MSPGRRFIELRDQLLRLREDYAAAQREFRWPQFEHFNWAHDYFDAIAAGNDAAALRVVDDAGGDQTLSFAELAQRSDQVANFLAGQGLRAGERLLLMLPNSVPLWETMLAAIKLGAVMIPATTLLEREDLRDRLERGQVKAILTDAGLTGRFAALPGAPLRIAVGGAPSGWIDYQGSRSAAGKFSAAPTRAADLLLLYFTSGTTARPKVVAHSHVSYPVGHLSTMYWLGIQPGDVHLNLSSPGWAKHAWSCFFAPWNAQATILTYHYERFDARALLEQLVRCRVTTFCAPPTVWRMLIQSDLRAWRRGAARGGQRRGAAEPGGDRAGACGVGPHHPRRLRTDREHRPGGQSSGAAAQARFDGASAAGLSDRAAEQRRARERGGRDLHRPGAAAARTDAGLSG